MHKKFEINGTKIKGGCQSGRKVVTHNSKSDSPLEFEARRNTYSILIHDSEGVRSLCRGYLGHYTGPFFDYPSFQ